MSPVPLWALHKTEIGAKPSRLCSHGGVFLGCLRAPVSITVWVRSLPRGLKRLAWSLTRLFFPLQRLWRSGMLCLITSWNR